MPRVTATLAGADFRSIHQLAPTPRPRGPSDTQRYLLLRLAVRNKIQKGTSYPGPEIIAKLATVPEVEPAELVKMPKRGIGIDRAPVWHPVADAPARGQTASTIRPR